MSDKAPTLRKGWMRKQGRSGLVKNWKTRFFVLADGKISYYVSEISESPYGDGLKGELNLVNSEVVEEHTKTINPKQVFIVSYNGENNILMETDDPKDTAEWVSAIKTHIDFYNKATSSRVQSMTISRSGNLNATTSPSTAPVRGSTARASTASVTEEPPASERKTVAAEDVTPTPSIINANEETDTSSIIQGESKRSSITRRKVSVILTPPTTTSTTSDNSSNNTSSSTPAASSAHPPVLEYKVYTVEAIGNVLIDLVVNFFTNTEERNKLLADIAPNAQTAVMKAVENLMEGDPGKRGEKVVIAAAVLFFLIIVGVGNRFLFYLIQTFMYIGSTILLLVGVSILLNGVWELKDHFSLLLTPAPGNKVVTTGVYQLVRHPIYCGVIMISFGWSISQRQIYKVVLSMILFIVLNYAAEREEEYLEKKHPKAYPLYANTKRAIIPFLY
eukprot:gene5678-6101_t